MDWVFVINTLAYTISFRHTMQWNGPYLFSCLLLLLFSFFWMHVLQYAHFLIWFWWVRMAKQMAKDESKCTFFKNLLRNRLISDTMMHSSDSVDRNLRFLWLIIRRCDRFDILVSYRFSIHCFCPSSLKSFALYLCEVVFVSAGMQTTLTRV